MSTRIAACARVLARSAAAVLAVSALAGCSANDATEHVAVTTTKISGTLGYSSPVINVFRHQKVVIDLTNNTDDMRAFAIDGDLADLGNWLDGKYRIAPTNDERKPDDDDSETEN